MNLLRCSLLFLLLILPARAQTGPLQAGAYAMDITPTNFPVIVNGGFLSRTASTVSDRLHARCVVLDNGHTRIALVIADSCMLPRELIDTAKALIEANTGIPADRVMMSSTHTHTAPSAMGALGTPPDEAYVRWVPARLAEGVARAAKRLAPAGVAFRSIDAANYVASRRWIWRPGAIQEDPFGEMTVRANMHPGYQNPDAMGPTGPEDPALTAIGIFHADGRPLALLGNFGMHYFAGVPALSADYFARYADYVKKGLQGDDDFVGILSNGTSGDMYRKDYSQPKPETDISIDDYALELAQKTVAAFGQNPKLQREVELNMAEALLTLQRRTPDAKRLAWAHAKVVEMGDRLPKTKPEVYAKEALHLREHPERELKLQAIRIGDILINTLPTETYALTGLRLKALSPLKNTMVISLANGGEGYIPPPEQYVLGGYNTWPARSAALEEAAEPKIVAQLLALTEKVCGQPTHAPASFFPDVRSILPEAQGAQAWFSLHDFNGPIARNSIPGGRDATYESGVVFYLPGMGIREPARAAHFAGGALRYELDKATTDVRVSFWFWNAMPYQARYTTGYLLSRGDENDFTKEYLGITGAAPEVHEFGLVDEETAGRLVFHLNNPKGPYYVGTTRIQNRTWHHVMFIRKGNAVKVFLDHKLEIDQVTKPQVLAKPTRTLYIGGRSDGVYNFEGKIDEVGIW
jgi:hypothetical protein